MIAACKELPTAAWRSAEGEHPFAVILACADSRVSPELILDQWIGDLFVVRVAGNIVSPANYGILGSIEYGVKALGVKLIMVLGHSRCSAVEGAVKALSSRHHLSGRNSRHHESDPTCRWEGGKGHRAICCSMPYWRMCNWESARCIIWLP